MPTLAEYEARGIDITTMTAEQLIDEGYVTPMNELPTLIDALGHYRTRNGCMVTIHEITPRISLACTEFNAKGTCMVVAQKGGRAVKQRKYMTWHQSGRRYVHRDSAFDIVEKLD